MLRGGMHVTKPAETRRTRGGRALYRAAADADLEGIVAKKLADPRSSQVGTRF
jgi:ATP-dependent DNA ligase